MDPKKNTRTTSDLMEQAQKKTILVPVPNKKSEYITVEIGTVDEVLRIFGYKVVPNEDFNPLRS